MWPGETWTSPGPASTGVEVAIFIARPRRAEVLVAHRIDVLGGHWHVVAGALEHGETPQQAAERELREETGLRVSLAEEESVHEFAYAIPGSSGSLGGRRVMPVVKMRVVCFLVEVEACWEPILNWEHDAYAWLGPAEACERLRWPSMARALRHVVPAARFAA
jgi:8-oxo-dGTP pyrophosphatase MutT (NUDIX family)